MGPRHGIIFLLVVFCGFSCDRTWAAPTISACATQGVTVSSERQDDASVACAVAAETDARLESLGLEIHEPVRIEISENLDVAAGTCVALYSTDERKVQVLPVDCLEGQPGRASAFPEMRPKLLFRSLIIHELVHAYMDRSAAGQLLPRIAYEYLAYAIQLDALPEADRSRILARADVGQPVDFEQINDAFLNLSPLRFAVLSWLHFRQEGGDAALVQRIVKGRLLVNSLAE